MTAYIDAEKVKPAVCPLMSSWCTSSCALFVRGFSGTSMCSLSYGSMDRDGKKPSIFYRPLYLREES